MQRKIILGAHLLLFCCTGLAEPNGPHATATLGAAPSAGALRRDPEATDAQPLGLAYTIYIEKGNAAERVSPRYRLRAGDKIRWVFQSNTDGYLYMFSPAERGSAELVFPHCRLADGRNLIPEDTPFEVPSSSEKDPGNRWLEFGRPPTSKT